VRDKEQGKGREGSGPEKKRGKRKGREREKGGREGRSKMEEGDVRRGGR